MRRHTRLIVLTAALVAVGTALTSAPAAATVRNGRIAFNLDPGTGPRIESVSLHGTHLRTLVSYAHAGAESPDFSPRGVRMVFTRVTDSGCHIVLASRDGTHRRDLTGDRRGCESTPTFTPSGQRIVFVVQRCDGCPTWISAMDLSGGHRHRILPVAPGTTPEDVVLSPGGRRIAFESTDDSARRPFHRALLVAHRDGTHLHTLVPYRYDVGVHFDWSSTGRWLVYTRWSESPPGHEANVALISPDGSHAKRLTHVRTPGRSAGGATFSPDGRWVVYRIANTNQQHYWIATMRVDGSRKTRLRALSLPPQGNAWAPKFR